MNFSPDGRTLATGDRNGRIRICMCVYHPLNSSSSAIIGLIDVGKQYETLTAAQAPEKAPQQRGMHPTVRIDEHNYVSEYQHL